MSAVWAVRALARRDGYQAVIRASGRETAIFRESDTNE